MAADFLFIANPTSGAKQAGALATSVRDLLLKAGRSVELQMTSAPGHAGKLAAEAVAGGVKTVVGCCGDGTLQEIACALEGTPAALGIVPGGRCNDFAGAFGLHKKLSPEELARILLDGTTRLVDLGAIGERRFLTVATMGFDSEVSRFVETRKLWLKGTAAYLYGVVRVLLRFRAPLVTLKGDFGTHEGRVLLAATGNAPSYGGAMHIAPAAKLDDGLFHICVVDEVSRFTVLRILPRVLKGTHVTHPAVRMLSSKTLDIETPEQSQWICADGETMCQTPCRLSVRPGALRVIVPPAPA